MCTSRKVLAIVASMGLGFAWSWAGAQTPEPPAQYGFGQDATEAQIEMWDIDISPSGEGLPAGRGTVKRGAQVFAAKCAMCHGPNGTEGPTNRLVGGRNTLKAIQPIKTVGSYWPYATTIFDYIRRAMPFTAPQSLKPDEVYSLVAWLLFQNGIVPEDIILDANTLPGVRMPNREGFVPDPRPDVGPP